MSTLRITNQLNERNLQPIPGLFYFVSKDVIVGLYYLINIIKECTFKSMLWTSNGLKSVVTFLVKWKDVFDTSYSFKSCEQTEILPPGIHFPKIMFGHSTNNLSNKSKL